MTFDQLGRRLWERFPAPSRWAFFSCILTGLLMHLYAFTNLIPNSDGLSRVCDPQQMTISGRWFLHYASALNVFTQMPMAIGLLALVFLGLAAGFLAPVLGLESRALAGLSGALLAAFPCLGYTFLYMFTASAYCLAVFLAVLGVWLTQRFRFGWALGAGALALSMGIYQAYAAVAIGAALLAVFARFLHPGSRLGGTVWLGLRMVLHLALGAALYYVVLLVFLRVKGLELLSYLGMDAASSGYPIGQLPRLVLTAYKQVAAFFFWPGSSNGFTTAGMAALDLLLLLLGAFCLWQRLRGTGKELWRGLGALAMLLLLPLGVNFGQILSPFSAPTPLMKYAYVLVVLAALQLLQLAEPVPLPRLGQKALPPAAAAWAALFLLFCLNTNNLLYTAADQAHRATQSYATRLLARVESCEGYQPGMQVAVVGAVPPGQLQSQTESFRQIRHYSVPTGTVLTLNKHIYYYFSQWLNTPVEEPDEALMQAISDSPEFQAMPLYPAPGSVRVLNGRVVVRMAEKYTPKAPYEVAYENRR